MTPGSQGEGVSQHARNPQSNLFGVPLGDLGWFASLLIGTAAGFVAFFATTFLGIVGIMIYNSTGHHTVDYALSYRRGGLTVGLITLVAAWTYLGALWAKRMARKS